MIIFMGVAGSGKSMQGRLLADDHALPWLSTGEFLRMLISGEKRKYMLEGHLLDDADIIALVQKIFTVVDIQQEFVLDGFPRTSAQADWLLGQMRYGQLSVTAVVHLRASEEVVKSRLLSRGRLDDNEAAIHARFKEYQNMILPILDQFKSAGVPVIDVDGERPAEDVHESITKAINTLRQKNHVHQS